YRDAGDVVAGPKGAVLRGDMLRDHEAGNVPCSRRGVGDAGEHEMDDVRRQVVLPETDEDFGAKDLVGAVGLGYSAGADGPQVGPGVGFGEAHRAGPLARDQLREVGSPEVVVAMRFEHVDCPLREQQAYG